MHKWMQDVERVRANRERVTTADDDVERAIRMLKVIAYAGKLSIVIAEAAEAEDRQEAMQAFAQFFAQVVPMFSRPQEILKDLIEFSAWCGTPIDEKEEVVH